MSDVLLCIHQSWIYKILYVKESEADMPYLFFSKRTMDLDV